MKLDLYAAYSLAPYVNLKHVGRVDLIPGRLWLISFVMKVTKL